MQGEQTMTTPKTGTHEQWLVARLAGVRRASDIKETCMSAMMKVRRHVLGMALATAVALTTGGPLHAASPSKAVPVSPSEGTAQELSAPPAEAGDLSLPDNARPGTTVYKMLPPQDAQTRAGGKLPCGLSYYENPASGGTKSVVYSIGNCHNFRVSRAVNFDPSRPTPQSDCMHIGPHFTDSPGFSGKITSH
jgi:hypothetical protein